MLSLAVLGAEERIGTPSSTSCMKIPSKKQDVLGSAGQGVIGVANNMLISASLQFSTNLLGREPS